MATCALTASAAMTMHRSSIHNPLGSACLVTSLAVALTTLRMVMTVMTSDASVACHTIGFGAVWVPRLGQLPCKSKDQAFFVKPAGSMATPCGHADNARAVMTSVACRTVGN